MGSRLAFFHNQLQLGLFGRYFKKLAQGAVLILWKLQLGDVHFEYELHCMIGDPGAGKQQFAAIIRQTGTH
jgi:hypothetical protein